MRRLGEARWGYGCVSSYNAIKDPYTHYRYYGSAIKKQIELCNYNSGSLNGTAHRL